MSSKNIINIIKSKLGLSTKNTFEGIIINEYNELEKPIWHKIYKILLISTAIGMVLASFFYGLSGDEAYANGMGHAAWDFITSFGKNRTYFRSDPEFYSMINRDGVLTNYGNIFDIIAIWLNYISPFDEYTTRHILNAFVGFLGIFFTSKITQKFWGNQAAVLTVLIMVFYPFYFGHAMNNPKDAPLAAFYIMGIYFLIRFCERLGQLKFTDYLWLILSIILAIDVRIAGLLLVTYFPIIGLVYFKNFKSYADEKNWMKVILPFVIVAVISYFGCSIFWPYALQNPIVNPLKALSFLSNFKVVLGQIWEGAIFSSAELPANYLFSSIFITSPWVFLVGLALVIVCLLVFWKNIPNKKMILFIVFTGLFPLFYILFKGSNVYHLWRHELFVFPSLAIVSSIGWSYIKLFFIKTKLLWANIAVFGLFLLEPIVFTIRTFPNNINYFNGSVGGVEGAYGNYEMDFYYNSMKGCVDYLNKNILKEAKDTVVVASNAFHLLMQYNKDKHYKARYEYVRFAEKNMKYWDYAIFHISLVPADEIADGFWASYNNPIYENNIFDKPLCVLLKRPSYEDIKIFEYFEEQKIPEALQSINNYLQKDPNNPTILYLKTQVENFLRQNSTPKTNQ